MHESRIHPQPAAAGVRERTDPSVRAEDRPNRPKVVIMGDMEQPQLLGGQTKTRVEHPILRLVPPQLLRRLPLLPCRTVARGAGPRFGRRTQRLECAAALRIRAPRAAERRGHVGQPLRAAPRPSFRPCPLPARDAPHHRSGRRAHRGGRMAAQPAPEAAIIRGNAGCREDTAQLQILEDA